MFPLNPVSDWVLGVPGRKVDPVMTGMEQWRLSEL